MTNDKRRYDKAFWAARLMVALEHGNPAAVRRARAQLRRRGYDLRALAADLASRREARRCKS